MLLCSYLAVGKVKAMTRGGDDIRRNAQNQSHYASISFEIVDGTLRALLSGMHLWSHPRRTLLWRYALTDSAAPHRTTYPPGEHRGAHRGSPEQHLPPYRSPWFVMGLVLAGPAPRLIFHLRPHHHHHETQKIHLSRSSLTSSRWGRHEASSRRE